MALTLTVHSSRVKAEEYGRQQGLGIENSPLWLAWQCLTHWQYKGPSSTICGATQEPEICKVEEELKWLQNSDSSSMQWDNRAKNCISPDFERSSLWIGSSYCPKWRLKCLEDASPALGQVFRAQGDGPSFQSGTSSYLENKLTEKDGIETLGNCNEMQQQKAISILLATLKASSTSRDLDRGKKIHADAIESGDDSNIYVASAMLDMYAKCGSMVDARGVFDRIPRHNVVSWTSLILGYAENGEGELALQLFACMQSEGCAPNRVTFLGALKACTSLAATEEAKQVDGKLMRIGSLEKGMAIHSQAAKSGCNSEISVAITLVDMYAKCGSMGDARGVFDRMPCHNVVSWTALILGCTENGEGELALQLFVCMQSEGCAPNARTFVPALKACTSLAAKEEGTQGDGKLVKMRSLEKGVAMHSQAAKSGCDSDIFVASILVDMYAKCGSMVDARGVFDRMLRHNVVAWNALMLGYTENGEAEVTLQLFACMQFEGCAPDARTFVAALRACTSLAAKEEGKQVDGKLVSLEKGMAIHSQAAKIGCDSDIFVASTLVDMYAKCGSLVDALGVFDKMIGHNVVSWNALMLGYAENGQGEVTLHLFAHMRLEGCAPDRVTFLAGLKACTILATREEGKQVDGKLMKIGSLEKGMAIHSQAAKSSCYSDIYVQNTLVDMYARCGSMMDARGVFDRMLHQDVVSWNALMLGHVDNGEEELALQLFARMQSQGCLPDVGTFVAALKACGSVAALEVGKTVHADICSRGLESNAVVATCLVNFYGKCGSMVDAQQVFDSLATRDLVTWSALIAGYSHQGDTNHVFHLFERMQKERVQPDGITFLSILTVCSHAGLVDKGKEYFYAMCSDYGINPGIEHYACMVDMLGRANQMDDVVAMVKAMPVKPDVVTWKTILGACQKWKNVVVGRLAFESLLRVDEKQAAAYVLMANIYGSVGMWEEKSKVQAMRKNAGAWKKPGQSWWTDQAGMVHRFVVGDTSHPQSEDIHSKLKHVLVKMKEQGYVADVGSVSPDISDDEKEDALCGHSERLAIACALINSVPGTTIRIVKNLRVCEDCHKATSIISKIEQRPIVCRDASRFHVFENGKCSCRDFW